MSYIPYANVSYYNNVYGGTAIPPEDIEKSLTKASRHIDSVTFNRLVVKGIVNMPEYTQDIVRQVCCEMADFEYENAELIQSVLKSYGINGVTMEFGQSWNVFIQNGIAMRRDTYALLSQTGLCCRNLGV